MAGHAIHHVTAVTAQIADNMRFYTEVLGLRLVKRSVNQDDVTAYHLFYADTVGSPGTDLTFFDWSWAGANEPGPGTIALTSFAVPGHALDWWEARLKSAGCSPKRSDDEQEQDRILFADPEGQRLELVDSLGLQIHSQPWSAAVPADYALRGIVGVSLESARPESTTRVLTELLGYAQTRDGIFETSDGPYGRVKLVPPTRTDRAGKVGAGGVHHVAFRASDDQELNDIMQRVEKSGLRTSGYVDRFWFHSIYFREPGGILFEVATEGPGFGVDEDMEHLGKRLVLPPFLEPQRHEIERGLKPIPE